jgi:hypothetical protein
VPHVVPTPKDIKARFPEFAGLADSTIAFAIEVAKRSVDVTWTAADHAIALAYLTAHILVTDGKMADNAAAASAVGPLVSESLGDASWTFAQKASVVGLSGMSAELATTSYGQRFLLLQRSNFPAVALC